MDVTQLVAQAAETMAIAKFATLSTQSGDGSISSRLVYPTPPTAEGESPHLHFVHLGTNKGSRKFKEIAGNPQATLLYFDQEGFGVVTLKGTIIVCDEEEATARFQADWKRNYPEGSKTDFYSLLRFEVLHMEFISYKRFNVDEGNLRPQDWRPLTLARQSGSAWEYVAPANASL
mmetsp:Transcript_69888/g.167759  ORF Transcript_69888/g.167759 Transcript_69888/m.167759 type:complete len:175 (+) Transcript_69888:87-611(+)